MARIVRGSEMVGEQCWQVTRDMLILCSSFQAPVRAVATVVAACISWRTDIILCVALSRKLKLEMVLKARNSAIPSTMFHSLMQLTIRIGSEKI